MSEAGADRVLAAGDLLLLDLWAGVALGTVFADQTWMGSRGESRLRTCVVRGASC